MSHSLYRVVHHDLPYCSRKLALIIESEWITDDCTMLIDINTLNEIEDDLIERKSDLERLVEPDGILEEFEEWRNEIRKYMEKEGLEYFIMTISW